MGDHAKIAVVTGASSGIGLAAAIALNEAWWTVVISGRRQEALDETIQGMPEASRTNSLVVCGDLSSPDDVRILFDAVKTAYDQYGSLQLQTVRDPC